MVPFYRFCSRESIHHRSKIDLSNSASSIRLRLHPHSPLFWHIIIICSAAPKSELVDGDVLARRALRLGPHGLRRVEVLAELLQRVPLLAPRYIE